MSVKRAAKPAYEHRCDWSLCGMDKAIAALGPGEQHDGSPTATVAVTFGRTELPPGWARFTRTGEEFCSRDCATQWINGGMQWGDPVPLVAPASPASAAAPAPEVKPRRIDCTSRCSSCGRACWRGVDGHQGGHECSDGHTWGAGSSSRDVDRADDDPDDEDEP